MEDRNTLRPAPPFPGEMSNLAIQRSAPMGTGGPPPGMEADYVVIRPLPLFEGIPDNALIHAMSQGGIVLRSLERDMFVLEPIGLAAGQPAPVVYVARGQVAAAVFTENDLQERRAAQIAHENATAEEREAE